MNARIERTDPAHDASPRPSSLVAAALHARRRERERSARLLRLLRRLRREARDAKRRGREAN